jgi:hypothetical protein
MESRWASLPEVLVRRVLAYTGVIKYRRGEYVNQVRPEQHAAIMAIPRVLPNTYLFTYYVQFSSGNVRLQKTVMISSYTTLPWYVTYDDFNMAYAIICYHGVHYVLMTKKTWRWYTSHVLAMIRRFFVHTFKGVKIE